MKYNIQVNPLNPVNYLACCGVFEILARFDFSATSWWILEPHPCFWIESEIAETSLLDCLTRTLTDWSQWQVNALSSNEDKPEKTFDETQDDNPEEDCDASDRNHSEGNEVISLKPSFHLHNKTIVMTLDWWYETLTPEQKIKMKSGWKMYAGQQTADKISRAMTICAAILHKQNQIIKISQLIELSIGMKGRFGFDPRASRNALDTGFSANDLNLDIPTFPFSESLATIAAQHFFPPRNRQSGGITSSRGWIENKIFRYALWKPPLPIQLARIAAFGAAIDNDAVIPLQAERAYRDRYSNFNMATLNTWKLNN